MQTSESINELSAALAKAQGEITGALKDSANPFFKSKYADLASCWDACRVPLAKNGLAVIQVPETTEAGLTLITTLAHSSGQWIRGSLPVKPKDDTPQAMGSALTYARRYALTAFIGIAQVDDDGNAASGKVSYGGTPAYDAPHSPKGDMGKSVSADKARETATRMRAVLEADLDETDMALKVADLHDELNKDSDLYVAAADQLSSKERASWKRVLAFAKAREREERAA
jgi:hypothetical protein